MVSTIKGKRILITGATDGIGLQTSRELAAMGAELLLHGRDPSRLQNAVSEIESIPGVGKVKGYLADFSSLDQVRSMGDEICNNEGYLDVLINNAGIFMKDLRMSVDGYEMTFAVNHLAPFALTLRLKDLMKHSAPSRIVNVASMAHKGSKFDINNLQGESGWSTFGAYSQSKLCNILFTVELAHRLEGTGVVTHCLHPGVINTKLLRTGFGNMGASLKEGAKTTVFVATSAQLAKSTGKYFSDGKEASPSREATDSNAASLLWDISEKLTGESWDS